MMSTRIYFVGPTRRQKCRNESAHQLELVRLFAIQNVEFDIVRHPGWQFDTEIGNRQWWWSMV